MNNVTKNCEQTGPCATEMSKMKNAAAALKAKLEGVTAAAQGKATSGADAAAEARKKADAAAAGGAGGAGDAGGAGAGGAGAATPGAGGAGAGGASPQ